MHESTFPLLFPLSMPTVLASLSRAKAQSGQCSCHLDFTASAAPPPLSGRIILENHTPGAVTVDFAVRQALTDGPGLLVP